jgi:hypothetical protein
MASTRKVVFPSSSGRTLENLVRQAAALLKQGALKVHPHELFKTAGKLRHKAEEAKDAPPGNPRLKTGNEELSILPALVSPMPDR